MGRNQQKKIEKYIKNINISIKNTENNAVQSQNMIDTEIIKMIEALKKRKSELEKQLKTIKDKKVKIYNDNLDKAMKMNKELKERQSEWSKLLRNTNIDETERKNLILLQSQDVLARSKDLLKNQVIHSVNDKFHITFHSAQNIEFIRKIGKIDGNEVVPELSVSNIAGDKADINIEMKCADDVALYGLSWKQTNGNNNDNDIFIDDDDEKKDDLSGYFEFKDRQYPIKNLKEETNYAVRVRAKISQNLWTNYSKIKFFKTKKKYSWIFDSTILTDPNEIAIFENLLAPQLKSILNRQKFKLTLIYRNSRDGNSGTAFHSKCNGHANTITLVHSNYGHIFGGFTKYKWRSAGDYGDDKEAFLFLVRSAFNHPPRIYKNQKGGYAGYGVYDGSNYGPLFGGGYDLVIQQNGGTRNYSAIGNTYEGTGNELCGGDTHKTNMAQHVFKLNEYEVFAVN